MASVARAVEIRLAIKDADAAVAKLREFGKQGESALKTLVTASAPVDSALTRVDQAFAKSAQSAEAAGTKLSGFGQRLQALGQASGLKTTGLSNLSFQLQDIAVQAGAGTNAFQILLQQGGQLAGSFAGPVGAGIAVVSTALGLAGIAYQHFSGAADDAKEKAKEFTSAIELSDSAIGAGIDSIRGLEEAYRDLSSAQKGAEEFRLGTTIEVLNTQVGDVAKQIQEKLKEAFAPKPLTDLSEEGQNFGQTFGQVSTAAADKAQKAFTDLFANVGTDTLGVIAAYEEMSNALPGAFDAKKSEAFKASIVTLSDKILEMKKRLQDTTEQFTVLQGISTDLPASAPIVVPLGPRAQDQKRDREQIEKDIRKEIEANKALEESYKAIVPSSEQALAAQIAHKGKTQEIFEAEARARAKSAAAQYKDLTEGQRAAIEALEYEKALGEQRISLLSQYVSAEQSAAEAKARSDATAAETAAKQAKAAQERFDQTADLRANEIAGLKAMEEQYKSYGINIDDNTSKEEKLAHAVEMAEAAWRARNSVIQQGIDITTDAGKAALEAATNLEQEKVRLAEYKKEYDQLQRDRTKADTKSENALAARAKREAKLLEEPFKNAITGVQNAFTAGFEDIFKGGVNSFSDLADTVKDIFIRLAAEIASLMIIRPLLAPIAGAVGGAGFGGMTGGGFSGGIGQIFGGVGQMLNTSSLGTSINSLGAATGLFSAGSGGVASSVASVGSIGAGGGAAGLSGLGIPGAASSSAPVFGASAATLTSTLGVAALGYFGGQALAGLTGGNPTGAGIGGGLGAGIGFAVGGPIGAILGGVGGSLLGGLFGNNKPSNKEQGLNYNILTGQSDLYGQTGKKFSQENQDAAKAFAQTAAEYIGRLTSATGGKVGIQGFDVAVGSRDGVKLGIGSTQTTYGTIEEAASALLEAITGSLTGAGKNVTSLIQGGKLDFTDPEAALKQLDLAAYIDSLIKPANAAKSAFDDLNKTFNDAIETAKGLGLSTKELEAERDRQTKAMREGVQADIDARVGQTDSAAAVSIATRQIVSDYDALIAAGKAVGADTSKLIDARAKEINAVQNAAAQNKKNVQEQVQAFVSFGSAGDQVRQQILQVEATFQQLSAAAQAAGVDTKELAAARDRQIAAIRAEAKDQAAQEARARADQKLSVQEQIRQFEEFGSSTNALESEIASIRARFRELTEAAKEAGLSTKGLQNAMLAQIQAARQAAKEQNQAQARSFATSYYGFLGNTDPNMEIAAAQQAIADQYNQIVAEAKRLGQNINQTALKKSFEKQARDVRTEIEQQRAREKTSVQDQIGAFNAGADPTKQAEVQITAIRRQFEDLSASAKKLGLSEAGLKEARDAAIKAVRDQLEAQKQQTKDQIAAFLAAGDPAKELQVSITQVTRQFEELSKNAKDLGLSEAGLKEARDRQIEALKEQARLQKQQAQDSIASFLAGSDPIKQSQVQITAVWRQFEELSRTAKELGLSEVGLKEARDKAIKDIQAQLEAQKTSVKDQIASFIAANDPALQLQVQITSVMRQFEELSKAARELGISEEGLAVARDKQIAELRKAAVEQAKATAQQAKDAYQAAGDEARQYFTSLRDPFKGLLSSFDASRPGGLGRSFRANEAEVERLFSLAQGGDVNAIKALPDLISTTRDQINQLNASGPKTQAVERRLEEITRQVLALIDQQAKQTEASGPAVINETLKTIRKTFEDKFNELKSQIASSDLVLQNLLRTVGSR